MMEGNTGRRFDFVQEEGFELFAFRILTQCRIASTHCTDVEAFTAIRFIITLWDYVHVQVFS